MFGNGDGHGNGSGGGHGQGHTFGNGGGGGRNHGGAFGNGGFCICAKCNHKVPHQRGVKCTTLKCEKCGNTMVREELLNSRKQSKTAEIENK